MAHNGYKHFALRTTRSIKSPISRRRVPSRSGKMLKLKASRVSSKLALNGDVYMARKISLLGLETIGIVHEGDDIAEMIVRAAKREDVTIDDGDILVITSKIVAKAKGGIIKLREVKPSRRALAIAKVVKKDPRLLELILREAQCVVKMTPKHVIVRTRHGVVCANAGIDKSNVTGRRDSVLLLPEDPDAEARRIRRRIKELTGKDVAVVITDTYGRPLREGQVDFAIGIAGMKPFKDYRGSTDLFGYVFRVKRIAIADEIAAAAELVMGNGAEGIPVVIIKGLNYEEDEDSNARELNMPRTKWLFR